MPQDDDSDVVERTAAEEEDKKIQKLGYKKLARHYLADEAQKQGRNTKLTTAAYHQDTHILVVGFNNGCFYLYEMPDVNLIHSLRYNIIFYLERNVITL